MWHKQMVVYDLLEVGSCRAYFKLNVSTSFGTMTKYPSVRSISRLFRTKMNSTNYTATFRRRKSDFSVIEVKLYGVFRQDFVPRTSVELFPFIFTTFLVQLCLLSARIQHTIFPKAKSTDPKDACSTLNRNVYIYVACHNLNDAVFKNKEIFIRTAERSSSSDKFHIINYVFMRSCFNNFVSIVHVV